jgi:hypothetical protein
MQQLQYALLIEGGARSINEEMLDTPEYILTKCAGLIRTDMVSRTVRFVHGTVHDYLNRNVRRLNHSVDNLAQTVIKYLLSENFLEDSSGIPPLKSVDMMYADMEQSSPAQSAARNHITDAAYDAIFRFQDRYPLQHTL